MWVMASEDRADCTQDRRYRVLVLLAAFASLRWGEVTALRRCDLDVDSGAVRVQRRTVVLSFLLTQSPAGLSRQWMQSWRVRGSRPGNDLLARRGAVRGSP